VTLNVVWILLKNVVRDFLCFSNDVRTASAADEVYVTELEPCIQIIRIESYSFLQLFEQFRTALETFIRTGQAPVCGRQVGVDLNRVTKLERCFLKLFVFQVGFAPLHVVIFGLRGSSAAGKENSCCCKKTEKAYLNDKTTALAFHLIHSVITPGY
jgi:hypothetical protein